MSLTDLKIGESAIIEEVHLQGIERHRIFDLGFISGSIVKKTHTTLFRDPSVYEVKNTNIALRKETTNAIRVRRA